METLEIKRSKFIESQKYFIKNGFKEHTKEMMGGMEVSDYEFIGVYPKAINLNYNLSGVNIQNKEKILGGIVFRNKWTALDIKYLFLEKTIRGKNVGTNLINKAIQIGKLEYKSKVAYLSTFSFQALNFYKKLGFKLEFIRAGYSKNISEYYLVKELN